METGDLHETRLNREQLIEVIACGRPGTEMPHFYKYAYEDTDCYGLKGKDWGSKAPRYPHSTPLTRRGDRDSRRLHHHGIRRKKQQSANYRDVHPEPLTPVRSAGPASLWRL
jgi:hypothetical protein